MRFFVKSSNHLWGDDEVLQCALIKCRLTEESRDKAYSDAIEWFMEEPETPLSKHLDKCLEMRADHLQPLEERETAEAIIYEYDEEKWKLYKVCEFTGSPTWEWIGEGEMPDRKTNNPWLRKTHVEIYVCGMPREVVEE